MENILVLRKPLSFLLWLPFALFFFCTTTATICTVLPKIVGTQVVGAINEKGIRYSGNEASYFVHYNYIVGGREYKGFAEVRENFYKSHPRNAAVPVKFFPLLPLQTAYINLPDVPHFNLAGTLIWSTLDAIILAVFLTFNWPGRVRVERKKDFVVTRV